MSIPPHRPVERSGRQSPGPVDLPAGPYLERLREWARERERSPAGVVSDLAFLLGKAEGWPAEAWASLPAEPGSIIPPAPPAGCVSPELLGQAYEVVLAPVDRRSRGAFFTPAAVARRLVDIALDPSQGSAEACCTPAVVKAGSVTDLPEVGDPSVGGGAFLLAAARRLAAVAATSATEPSSAAGSAKSTIGRSRDLADAIITEALWGADVDPGAVAVTRLALAWWAWRHDPRRPWPLAAGSRVVVGDALLDRGVWPSATSPRDRPAAPSRNAAIVGNPPFLGQLKRPTARSADVIAQLVALYGRAARGYVDTAALFMLAACRHAAPGTRVVLILPESALVAAHGRRVRQEVLERSRLIGLWLGGPGVFRADVRVCAPVLLVGSPHSEAGQTEAGQTGRGPTGPRSTETAIWAGPGVDRVPPAKVEPAVLADGPTWSPLIARQRGVPVCRPQTTGTIADLATATAGFRDQYYGLTGHVAENDPAFSDTAALITSGLIDPARCAWGRRRVRFAGRYWDAPVVRLDALDRDNPELARWVKARLRPKLLVATQSKVVEAAADPSGVWVPSVPVVSVEPHDATAGRSGDIGSTAATATTATADPARDPMTLWRLLAVLISPVTTAWALEHYGGAGLASSAVKLSARQLLNVPLPSSAQPWESAARHCQSASDCEDEVQWRNELLSAAELMNSAYGLTSASSDELLSWWLSRLPGPATAAR